MITRASAPPQAPPIGLDDPSLPAPDTQTAAPQMSSPPSATGDVTTTTVTELSDKYEGVSSQQTDSEQKASKGFFGSVWSMVGGDGGDSAPAAQEKLEDSTAAPAIPNFGFDNDRLATTK